METAEQAAQLLRALRENNPGVAGAMLLSRDGRLLVQNVADEAESESILGPVTMLLRLQQQHDIIQQNGGFVEMRLTCAEREFVLYRAGEAVLAICAISQTNIGMIMLEAQQAAAEIMLHPLSEG